MLIIVQIILSTLFIFSIKCDSQFIDTEYEQFSSSNFDITKMFSSSSPYPEPKTTSDEDSKDCKPIRLWLLTRHGSKHPGKEILEDINNNLVPNIQGNLKNLYEKEKDKNVPNLTEDQKQIITGIMEWENVLASANDKYLNENGRTHMKSLGTRLKNKFKTLTDTLQKHEIYVLTAIEQRCITSAELFLETFYQENSKNIIKKNDSEDKILKLPKLDKETYKIIWEETGKKERAEDIFFNIHCPKIIKRIQEFLFPIQIDHYEQMRKLVTADTVKSMYYACMHGYNNLNTERKPAKAWCQLFSFEDLQMFEAMYDVQYWYQRGYYLERNKKHGTPIIKDMLNFINDPNGLKLKLFVGHTSNCFSIITRLNLFRDDDLHFYNILDKPNRKWKTSFITPFGCNIMVVVYDCNNQTNEVSIFLNEVPLEIILDNGKKCKQCPKTDVVKLISNLIY